MLLRCWTWFLLDAYTAMAEAHRVDEVKDIRDKAEAMAAYARQAKDNELIQYATEIKVRAERRCGELLRVTAERGERATQAQHGRGVQASVEASDTRPPTLADMGLTRDESSRYQQLAAMPAEHFETTVITNTMLSRCWTRPPIMLLAMLLCLPVAGLLDVLHLLACCACWTCSPCSARR